VEIANWSQPRTEPTDLLKVRLAAGEIPRIVRRLRDGKRDIDQVLIDIERETASILHRLDIIKHSGEKRDDNRILPTHFA
jgi:hypothetical protein